MRVVKWPRSPALTPAIVAFAVGVVAPLALPSATTWDQRAALGILLGAAAAWLGPRGGIGAAQARIPRLALIAGGLALLVVLATAPLALASERVARAEMAGRAGMRLLQLGEPARAVARYDQARRLGSTDPTIAPALAEAHWRLAESAVAGGLSADGYTAAADRLAAALEADPSRQDAARLAKAVAAVRMADQIWNQYDWPRTIAELRKARSLCPDLPGIAQKLADAEASQAAAARR